ncbi:transmembrane protein 273-like [Acanthochromis polyacanthus]|uniref:transmembrane protein 273-like n=1 Tax=Acanthochromis polyacanthus TaxID=80966 RepID=UPI0022348E78|nr:transmembrane protein 273-like [Acanthochromis polyacanthus]
MRAFETYGCLSAVIRAVLITDWLLMSVRGDGADSEEQLEIKYVLIGCGIGLFLVVGFILMKVCIIRKQVCETEKPHQSAPSHLSQSERHVTRVSSDL